MEQLPPLRLIPAVIYCHICGVISLDNKEKSPAPSASQAYFLAPALHLLILSDSRSLPAWNWCGLMVFSGEKFSSSQFGICIVSLELSREVAALCFQMEHPWLTLSPCIPHSCAACQGSGTALQTQVQIIRVNSLPT